MIFLDSPIRIFSQAASGGGGSSFTLTEIEVDFGSVPLANASFIVVQVGIVPSSLIGVFASGNAPTGLDGNPWEMDAAMFSAVAGNGQFVLSVNCFNGSISGPRKLLYTWR